MGVFQIARLLLVAVLLGTGGCAVNPVTGESELMLVSEDQEIALGHEAYPTLRWQDGGPLEVDEGTRAYLDGIVRTLSGVSHRPNLPVDFTLESSSVPNAWAVPGHTAMNRGLLQSLENEAQFAFVMGHEMGHVAARHSAKRETYSLLTGGLIGLSSAVFGGESAMGDLALGLGALGTGLVLLRYDRSQELEADRLGVLYMARAGYDPGEALRAHEALNRSIDQYLANLGKRREDPGGLAELLSTHPRHEARVGEIRGFIREIPAADLRTHGDGRFAERWASRTAGVRALAPAYVHYERARLAFRENKLATAQREVSEAMRLADQAQFTTVQAAMFAKEGRLPEARSAYARALSRSPGYQPALHGLGVVEFAQRRYPAAIPLLEESLRLRPGFPPSEHVLGLALGRLGRDAEAIPHLRRAAEGNPRHPEVYGHLAQAYERAGDRRSAFDAWRAQARVAPDSELGREASERLRVLAATVAEPYTNGNVRVRLEYPLVWRVAQERRSRTGGEVVLRRDDPTVVFRVASADLGTRPDLEAHLDAGIRERIGRSPHTVRVNRGYRLSGRTGIAKTVESAGVEYLFATAARGNRIYWVDVAAKPAVWRDRDVREEILRILDSLTF